MNTLIDNNADDSAEAVTQTGFLRVDHIGIVVNDLDTALQTYCNGLGFRLLQRITIAEQMVEAAFLDAGNSTVELIAPTDSTSGTARFLQTRGEGTHHICFEVEDIVATLAALEAQGLRLIDAAPRQGVHGLVAFVHPKATHGTMIELLQKEHGKDHS
ncbi:MAG: methylmalonyl-CoA epimerase [Caldilineaceae bacterium]|nr:methylmalonyl-CoA epimerase [Caldilineaceae bacterium]